MLEAYYVVFESICTSMHQNSGVAVVYTLKVSRQGLIRGCYDNRRGYFRISARCAVLKPHDVTVAIRNSDLIGPSELALAFYHIWHSRV